MTELTAELIVDQHSPHDVQISPDGKQIAYTLAPLSKKEEHATSAIWIASTDHAREARQFTSGEAHDHHARWSLTADNWLFSLTGPNAVPPSSISSPLMGEKRWL